MHILSISNTPHDPSQGSGYGITGYLSGLKERGHLVDAYGPADWSWKNVRRGKRYVNPLMIAYWGLKQYITGTYDLVELWGGDTWLLAVLLRRIDRDLPIVHHSNGIEQHRIQVQKNIPIDFDNVRWFQVDLSPLYDLGLHAADAIVTLNEYDIPFLKSRGYVDSRHLHAIDTPLPESYLDRSVDWKRSNRIGYCGSWIPRKGTDIFKEDMTRFLKKHPDWTFSVVGAEQERVLPEFPESVQPQIEVTSFIERKKLAEWYESLAIFAIPSFYDSFGLVMSEAMACGAALIASNVGFASSLTHREDALILPDCSSPHLYETLSHLAEDEDMRQEIATNGYERVQSLRWDNAVGRLESIYQGLIFETPEA